MGTTADRLHDLSRLVGTALAAIEAAGPTTNADKMYGVLILTNPVITNMHNAQGGPDVAWIEAMLESDILAQSARLLSALLGAFQSASRASNGWLGCEMVLATLACAAGVAAPMEEASQTITLLATGAAPTAKAKKKYSSQRFVEALAQPKVLDALAKAACFVREHAWRAATEEGIDPTPGQTAVPTSSAKKKAILSACFPQGGCASAGARVLSAVAGSVFSTLSAWRAELVGEEAARGVLRALQSSGALAAVAAAVLAAPPVPTLAAGATAVDGYTHGITVTQLTVCIGMQELSHHIERFPAALELLADPHMLRLRRTALEQVAATAGGGLGELVLRQPEPEREAEADGEDGGDDGDVSGGGGGGGGLAGGAALTWPSLSRHSLRCSFGTTVQLTEQLCKTVNGAVVSITFAAGISAASGAAAAAALFPSRAAAAALSAGVCRAMCARAEVLGWRGAKARPNARVVPRDLVKCAMYFPFILGNLVMKGARASEEAACLPDVLAAHAWVLRLQATPAGLSGLEPDGARLGVCSLMDCASGSEGEFEPNRRFKRLGATGRAACVQRLLDARLLRSLDRIARWAAASGGPPEVPVTCAALASGLMTPLVRASLARWREGAAQQRARQQQPQQQAAAEGQQRAAEAAAGGAEERWPAAEELGLLVTLCKFFRRGAAQLAASGAAGQLLLREDPPPAWSQANLLAVITCSEQGLHTLLAEVEGEPLASVRSGGGGSQARGGGGGGGAEGGGLAAARTAVWDAVAMGGCAALESLTLLLVPATDYLQRRADAVAIAIRAGRGSGRNGATAAAAAAAAAGQAELEACATQAVERGVLVAETALLVCRLLPAAAVLAAAPQRALVLLGRLMVAMEQVQWNAAEGIMDETGAVVEGIVGRRGGRGGGRGRGAARTAAVSAAASGRAGMKFAQAMQDGINVIAMLVQSCVAVLSSDEALRAACVPGWLWGGAGGREGSAAFSMKVLAAMAPKGPAAAAAALEPPQAPVWTVEQPFAARFDAWAWRDHEQYSLAVLALGRQCSQQLDLFEAGAKQRPGAAAAVGGAAVPWPPRALRLCGNPGCGNFGGGCEAGLAPKVCSGCLAVRYCEPECQRQHWRAGHREECPRLAAAGKAAAAAAAGAGTE